MMKNMYIRLLLTHVVWGSFLITSHLIPLWLGVFIAAIFGWYYKNIIDWAINAKDIHTRK